MSNELTKLIKGKHSRPRLRHEIASRPRLTALITDSIKRHSVLWVTGPAGSGKTTAVLDAFHAAVADVGWVTLDKADASPGRFLAYLEAAAACIVPECGGTATEALATGLPHTDAASLLAESLDCRSMTLVIDEAEHLADSAATIAALSAFVRYSPPSLTTVLISRRDFTLRDGAARGVNAAGRIDDEALRFTVDEAASALSLLDRPAVTAEAAVDATGGWVAGVLFEAWNAAGHTHGVGGESDALSGYLSTEIMSDLTAAEQQFLIHTAVLDEVTGTRADQLGQNNSVVMISRIRAKHLPISFSADCAAFRCHRQFREYLLSQLQMDDPALLRQLRLAAGEVYMAEDRPEEAVDEFLQAGDRAAARSAIEGAVLSVAKRGDFDLAAQWLNCVDSNKIGASPVLLAADILIAHDGERYAYGAERADLLRQTSGHTELLSADPDLVARMAWCYHLMCRFEEALELLEFVPPSSETAALRFAMTVDMTNDSTMYLDRPPDSGGATDALLARIDLQYGRFNRVLSSQRRSYSSMRSSKIGALMAVGRADEAEAAIDASPTDDWTTARTRVELMIELGRAEEAEAALTDGEVALAASGSPVSRMFNLILAAECAVFLKGELDSADRLLARLDVEPHARSYLRLVERADLLRTHIALARAQNTTAGVIIRPLVDLMVERDRLMLLPRAAIMLAETEWRADNPTQADSAADLALHASDRQMSRHQLLRALQMYPSVLSRRLDSEPFDDSKWHSIGRALRREGTFAHASVGRRVVVHEFGTPALAVDGESVDQPKLVKSIELCSYLVAHDGHAGKAELLDAMFDGRGDESARSYLRQAIKQLRDVAHPDITIEVDPTSVRWVGDNLTSESFEFHNLLRRAARQRGHERLDTLRCALEVPERGTYFPTAGSQWLSQRRAWIESLINDARMSLAECALELSDYEISEKYVSALLESDPHRESAWRLAMRLAADRGDTDEVIARFARCRNALADLGVTPADTTRRLLDGLRR